MNYISQINGFWKIAPTRQFSSSEISTYFALLSYCNNLNWLNPFVCHFEYICQTASISKNTFYACMERLHNEKLIEYTKGVKNSTKPKVFILNLENKTKNKTGIKLRTEEEQNEEQKGNLYKLLNKETIKLINNNYKLVNLHLVGWINSVGEEENLAEEKKLDFGSLGNEFVSIWNEWVSFRTKLKKKFVDIEAQQKGVNQLIKLSNGNKLNAQEIINKSIANSWQGLFALPPQETKSTYVQQRVL
jgi:hypothetical protein